MHCEGLKGQSFVLKAEVVEILIPVCDAMDYAHRLMKEEGILAGISSGAAVAAAVRVSQQEQHRGKTIVVILPDSGERYLSSALFKDLFTENETVQ